MIDHTKYDKIQTETLVADNYGYLKSAVNNCNDQVVAMTNQLLAEGYDIIDIKQDVILSRDRLYWATATIYYGKPKAIKK